MAVTELEKLCLRDPAGAEREILGILIGAEARGVTAEDAGFAVEARLRAMTETELDPLLTIDEAERLRIIVQRHLDGTTRPEESLLS